MTYVAAAAQKQIVNDVSQQLPSDLFSTNKKAYVDSVLNANKKLDWVKRLYEPNAPSIQVPGEKYRSTHLMSDDGKGYVYPSIVRQPNGTLKKLSEDEAYDYAKKTNNGIQLPQQQGSWLAANGYKIGTGVNNDILPNGKPTNNPNVTINDKGILNYEPQNINKMAGAGITPQQLAAARQAAMPVQQAPLPLSNDSKTQWNGFIDYLDKRGFKGNPSLDNRDTGLGQKLMEEYRAQNPHFSLSYDQVPMVQQGLQDYRNTVLKQWKAGKMQPDASVKTEDDLMPGLSNIDGWLGSKTSSYKFPIAYTTDPKTGAVNQNYGVNTAAYDAARLK